MERKTTTMKMISFCNKKGGVGKTTLCKNVAYKLALDGAKVLLIDLEPPKQPYLFNFIQIKL